MDASARRNCPGFATPNAALFKRAEKAATKKRKEKAGTEREKELLYV